MDQEGGCKDGEEEGGRTVSLLMIVQMGMMVCGNGGSDPDVLGADERKRDLEETKGTHRKKVMITILAVFLGEV